MKITDEETKGILKCIQETDITECNLNNCKHQQHKGLCITIISAIAIYKTIYDTEK